MENSKKRRHKAICPDCNGNGYKQLSNTGEWKA